MLKLLTIVVDVFSMIAHDPVTRLVGPRWLRGDKAGNVGTASESMRRSQPMLDTAARHLGDSRVTSTHLGPDAGFTLIELMVVLLILAILLAIAIPTFLGVTKSANDRAAQSNLNTALINAKAAYQTNSQTYTGVNTATLSSAEPSLTFQAAASTGQAVISMSVSSDGNGVVLAGFSKSGNCWYLVDNAKAVTQTTAPYGATATASGSTTAGALALPTAAGTSYAEAKGDATTGDCSASAPKLSGTGATYQVQAAGFPS